MAPRRKTRRTATAIMAVSLIGGLHARPASARPASSGDSALSQSINLWLDRRFADPWHASVTRIVHPYAAQTSTQDRGLRRYDIPEGPLETVIAAYQSASGVTVTFPADLVRGITSPGVSGLFTA